MREKKRERNNSNGEGGGKEGGKGAGRGREGGGRRPTLRVGFKGNPRKTHWFSWGGSRICVRVCVRVLCGSTLFRLVWRETKSTFRTTTFGSGSGCPF